MNIVRRIPLVLVVLAGMIATLVIILAFNIEAWAQSTPADQQYLSKNDSKTSGPSDKPDNGNEKITICHVAGRADDPANFITLTISENAVYGPGGHFNENGTPQAGHEQDTFGACPTPTATDTPTPTSTDTPTPTATETPTPTSTDTPTPTATETPTATDTPTPTATPPTTPTPPTECDNPPCGRGPIVTPPKIVHHGDTTIRVTDCNYNVCTCWFPDNERFFVELIDLNDDNLISIKESNRQIRAEVVFLEGGSREEMLKAAGPEAVKAVESVDADVSGVLPDTGGPVLPIAAIIALATLIGGSIVARRIVS